MCVCVILVFLLGPLWDKIWIHYRMWHAYTNIHSWTALTLRSLLWYSAVRASRCWQPIALKANAIETIKSSHPSSCLFLWITPPVWALAAHAVSDTTEQWRRKKDISDVPTHAHKLSVAPLAISHSICNLKIYNDANGDSWGLIMCLRWTCLA